MLIEKKERKANTLEARVYGIVTSLAEKVEQVTLHEDEVVLTSAKIWGAVTGTEGIEPKISRYIFGSAGKIGGCVQYTVGFIHFFGGGVAGPGNSGVVYTCKNNPP